MHDYDGVFKTDDDGNALFFPNGVMGKGYIIPSEEKKEKLRKLQKRFIYGSMIILGIGYPV